MPYVRFMPSYRDQLRGRAARKIQRSFKKRKKKSVQKQVSALKKFVMKTIENKQVNSFASNINVTSTGVSHLAFLRILTGTGDGVGESSAARIGNSVTLMKQQFNFNLKMRTGADLYNQVRILIVESMEGSFSLNIADVLQYSVYSTHGDLIFTSPYTTKTTTNKRYKVHYDKTLLMTQDRLPARVFKKTIKYGNEGKVINFQNTTDAIPTNHRLQFFIISDSTAVQHPRLDYSVRSTYKDS